MIRDNGKQAQDKMRLFLIYFLEVPEVSNEDIGEYQAALQAAGCDTSSLDYAKRFRLFWG